MVLLAGIGFGAYKYGHHAGRIETTTAIQQATKTTVTTPVEKVSPTSELTMNSVYKSMSKGKLGNVMTDMKGITLYTYAKDASGASNCSGTCLKNWPAYEAKSETGNFPENISVIKRSDGTLQYTWKGMPLYYYIKDKDSGDAYGDGVGSVWAVIKL